MHGWRMPCRQPIQRTMSYDTPSWLHLRTSTTVSSPVSGMLHACQVSSLPSSRLVELDCQHLAALSPSVSWSSLQLRCPPRTSLRATFQSWTSPAAARQRWLTLEARCHWRAKRLVSARTAAPVPSSKRVISPSSGVARPPTLMPARCVSTKDSSSSGSSASPELVDASSVKAWLRRSWARVQGDLVAGDREVAALMFVSEERGIRAAVQ
mmetsp:Transcript_28078/g.71313  ORF Transcript_28078/g.71313 Transcript_28078/m.71313 type:complete len:210 (+) Transcript_28078:463-1092(+)